LWETISDTIYEKINPYIEGKKRIMFRPAGMLNYTPLEAIWDYSHPESSCFRISSGESLKMLAEQPKKLDTALLIGGLDYSYENDLFHNEHGLPSSGRKYALPGIVQSSFSFLPETKREVEHIDSILRPSLHHIMLLQKKDATEELLRDHLIGNQFDIIHIASHSNFFSIKQALESTAIQPFIQSRTYSSLRENLLACNILVLSEAEIINYADLGTGIDADKNNILTGLEVFQMDLSDVSLVVIAGSNSLCSASTSCQNFGLAYALKHAGVKTVMACIWEVADTCTQLIMAEFYKQCVSGKSMHDALRAAQQYVRDYQEVEEEPVMLNDNLTLSEKRMMEPEGISTEKQSVTRTTHPYESPRYWAPFVLLDAVY
ncbi:MAG: CHAT domain-containing protein, partial [Prevotellaceae bacterium]|nr:CHAT domain-containing protein [Prevotellaceae bacterium]